MVAASSACGTRPCRPYGRSGARYSALPHCSRVLPEAPDSLGRWDCVPRGRLGVRDTLDGRPPPPSLSGDLCHACPSAARVRQLPPASLACLALVPLSLSLSLVVDHVQQDPRLEGKPPRGLQGRLRPRRRTARCAPRPFLFKAARVLPVHSQDVPFFLPCPPAITLAGAEPPAAV